MKFFIKKIVWSWPFRAIAWVINFVSVKLLKEDPRNVPIYWYVYAKPLDNRVAYVVYTANNYKDAQKKLKEWQDPTKSLGIENAARLAHQRIIFYGNGVAPVIPWRKTIKMK